MLIIHNLVCICYNRVVFRLFKILTSVRQDNRRCHSMVITNIKSDDIYNAFLRGAMEVISKTQLLNKINVFPVQDGDTGNNLASMMRMMISESTKKPL